MRWSVVACVLVFVLASGCSDKDPDPEPSASTSASTTAASSNTTAPANQPPTGTMAVSVPGGAAPLNVSFGLQGTDADGDALTWTLAFGDGNGTNGTALPANVTHVYAAAGAFNATFTLNDGTEEAAYHALVNVSANATAAAVLTFTGHVLFPDPVLSTEGECLFALSDQFGIPPGGGYAGDYFSFEAVGPGWTFAFDVEGMIAFFSGNDGASGEVPSDATGVQACSETAVDTDYTLTFTPP